MAMEQPKKITGGAFGRYMAEHRAALLKECAGKPATAALKLGSERFKAIADDERQKYQGLHEKAVADYAVAMEKFKASGGEVAAIVRKSKKDKDSKNPAKKEKDPNAPKKPTMGGYGQFMVQKREEIKAMLPKDHKVTDISKKVAELFKALSEEEKKKYDEMFKKAVEEYNKEMEAYKLANPEAVAAASPAKVAVTSPTKLSPKAKGQKRAEPDSVAKKPTAGKRGRSSKAASAEPAGVALDDNVISDASKLGLESQLRNLASRQDVISSGHKGS
jgi:hypothetical protein